ncbi:MAG: GEVED domain-containing protein, partial [Bacteroidota bacterium]
MKPIFQKSFSLYLIILLGLLATNANAQTWTIGTGTTSLNGRANPFCLEAEAQRVQFLYTNADLNAAGVPAGNITSMQFFVDNLNGWNGAINPFNGYTIRLYNTTVANLSGGWVTGTSTLVFNGNINSANGPSATGWHTISFSSTFNRAVNNGIVVEICFNSNTNVATLQSTTSFPTVGQSNIGVTVGRREFADNSTTGVCSSTGGVVFNLRPSIRFTNQPCPMGGPVAGTVTGPATACINSNVALTLTGASVGSAFAYQWQRNINSAGWTNEGTNATSLTIAYTGVATQYRVITTCVGTGATATTPAYTVNPVVFTSCYCSPTNTGAGGVGTMSRVIFAGINNVTGFAGFTDYFAGTPANVTLNGSFPMTIETTSPFPGVQVWVWIDYNQNAIFDVSERVQLTECGTPTVPYNKFCGIINVPPTALSGTTKMRIRYTWSNLTVANPACTAQYSWGEVEDYRVIIAPSVACSGAPSGGGNTLAGSTATGLDYSPISFTGSISGTTLTAGAPSSGEISIGMYVTGPGVAFGTQVTALGTGIGGAGTYTISPSQTLASTALSGIEYVCPSSLIYLSTQTTPNNGNISFQWERSTDAGINWSNLPGATSVNAVTSGVPLGATYMFRRRTTCSISGLESYSNPVTVLGNPGFVNCYCTPVMTDNSADRIDRVTINGYTRNSGSEQFRYSNTGTPTAPVTILNIGTTYPVEIRCGSWTGTRASVWVDLNTDADFDDPGEWMGQVQFTSYCGIPAGTGPANNIRFINVTIPVGTAPAPYTRMRVRMADPCQGIPLPANPWTDACSAVYFGETEDYGIQISVLPVCSGTPTGGTTVSSITNPCQGTPFTLSVTGATAIDNTGLSYQWESNSGSGWSN